jgi:hypothetical protein
VINRDGTDVLIIGPIRRLGLKGGGTPEQVVAYGQLVANLRRRLAKPLAVVSVHHTNKGGGVSGAYGPEPDTLLHVRHADAGRTTLEWEKTRWSSATHGKRMTLAWALECEGFMVIDGDVPAERVTNATHEQRVLDFLAAHPWATTDEVNENVQGRASEVRAARKRLLAEGRITRQASAEVGRPGKGMRWNISTEAGSYRVPPRGTPQDGDAQRPLRTAQSRPTVPPVRGDGDWDGRGNEIDPDEVERLADLSHAMLRSAAPAASLAAGSRASETRAQ